MSYKDQIQIAKDYLEQRKPNHYGDASPPPPKKGEPMTEKLTAAAATQLAAESQKAIDAELQERLAPTLQEIEDAIRAAATSTPPQYEASVVVAGSDTERKALRREFEGRGFEVSITGTAQPFTLSVRWKPQPTTRSSAPAFSPRHHLMES